MRLTRAEARWFLDGIATMASESWSATDLCPEDQPPDPQAVVNELIALAELDADERELFRAITNW